MLLHSDMRKEDSQKESKAGVKVSTQELIPEKTMGICIESAFWGLEGRERAGKSAGKSEEIEVNRSHKR